MSRYTTTIRSIVETINAPEVFQTYDKTKSINEKIEFARPKIFNFEYEIDEKYKQILETKILKHYYTREIAHETVDYWLFRLETLMQEIMPYYKILYETATLEVNPLYNYNMQEDNKRELKDKSENRQIFLDTPDGTIAELTDDFATNLTDNKHDSDSTENYIRNVVGNTGVPYGSLINDYRSSIINIDMMIISELNVLFFGLY